MFSLLSLAQTPPGAAGGNPMMPNGFPTPEQMQAQMENMQKMGLMPDAQTMQQMQAQQPPAGARNSRSIIAPRFLITPPAAPRLPASHMPKGGRTKSASARRCRAAGTRHALRNAH